MPVRLIAPPESTSEILHLLDASPAVTHLCVNRQSARKPSGDVVSFDVAREGTSVLEALRGWLRAAGRNCGRKPRYQHLRIGHQGGRRNARRNLRTRWSGRVWSRAQVRNAPIHHLPLLHDGGDHDRRHWGDA